MNMLRPFVVAIMILTCSACMHVLTQPDALLSEHDQVNTFTAQRPFNDVHAAISKAATTCYAMKWEGSVMPAGKIYVATGSGVRREIDDKVIEPDKLAMVAVVVRADSPLPPENYFLRADIKAVGLSATEVTTYNAKSNRAQRAFHRLVQRWVVDNVIDCSGIGPFG